MPFQFALGDCLRTFCDMYRYITWFLLLIVAYHVLHTVVLRWIGVGDPVLLSTVKEFLWFGFVVYALVRRRKQARAFLVNRKRLVVGLIALIIWSIGLSVSHGVSSMTMIVGLKYDILPVLILVSGMFIGTLFPNLSEERVRKDILMLCGIVIVGGLVRQLLKITFPDMISSLGYGPVGDYTLTSAPPLYYRTWPGGRMRLQWLFSWPNNYGYFLVAYFSVLIGILFKKNKWGTSIDRMKRLLVILFAGSIVRTLSRGVVVGVGVQLILLIRFFKPQWKRRIMRIVWVWVVAVVGLSVLKPASTLGHITARTDGRSAFAQQPLGHGLWSAWPAIHRDGIYLPENHYLQLLLDIWIPGLLLWIWVINWVIVCGWNSKVAQSSDAVKLRMLLLIGILGLLAEGLFLHVFEDSMVNYLFLLVVGGVVGMQKITEISHSAQDNKNFRNVEDTKNTKNTKSTSIEI